MSIKFLLLGGGILGFGGGGVGVPILYFYGREDFYLTYSPTSFGTKVISFKPSQPETL